MIDRKGIFSFLAITFILTYTIEGVLILSGFRITGIPPIYGQFIIAGVMWVPALATFLTIKFITHEGFAITNLRLGSWKPYLATWIIIPVCFFIIYALTWLLSLGEPDWQLGELISIGKTRAYIMLGIIWGLLTVRFVNAPFEPYMAETSGGNL